MTAVIVDGYRHTLTREFGPFANVSAWRTARRFIASGQLAMDNLATR